MTTPRDTFPPVAWRVLGEVFCQRTRRWISAWLIRFVCPHCGRGVVVSDRRSDAESDGVRVSDAPVIGGDFWACEVVPPAGKADR